LTSSQRWAEKSVQRH